MEPLLEVAKTVREAYSRAVLNVTRDQMGEDYGPICVFCKTDSLALSWYRDQWWCEDCMREDQYARAEEDRERIEATKRGFDEAN